MKQGSGRPLRRAALPVYSSGPARKGPMPQMASIVEGGFVARL